MSGLHNLTLYTQHDCPFCVIMKRKLSEWNYTWNEINISQQPEHKAFLKEKGHRTVPQLYYGDVHLNKSDTADFTKEMLESRLYNNNTDGGVEYWGT